MKGVILAAGTGSRLFPLTKSISKHLLPIYDKPMVYYPLSVLMLSEIREICIITNEEDRYLYEALLGDGNQFGISITYLSQKSPNGIAEAFLIAEEFIGQETVCLILGDNVFFGQGFTPVLRKAVKLKEGAIVFGYPVHDPERFGIVQFDECKNAILLEEKPKNPSSQYAVTGLYFYDSSVVNIAKTLKASERGELEITDVNKAYLERKKLKVEILGRGFTWLDAGTFSSLLEASQFVETIEKRQGYKIACLEEIAFNQGWITQEEVLSTARRYKNNDYGKYLFKLVGDILD
ncbi:glucose-1-phosphate thymidylyltransferase [Paenibacillus montaniterrae]|uniref:Glucose-1-phosphate thymidylyltransferase n=1 Tax=Paenibacillus montaniterrae TaxID=429341 RepID=A0A919YTB5_9BACL|nr:glucose-1-phosphate thymidylyltransferase RfbA [Paenibacillus montaniterrae]GIP19105.1 glucose-1-phosphate thymidylyltransferase [Paenibacillus montaniterrae]